MGIFAQIYNYFGHILSLAGLLFLSGFFSGSETALCSLSRAGVRRLRDLAGRRGRTVAELLSNPAQLFMTVLVGNTLVNVALSSIVASLSLELFDSGGLYLAIIISTFLLLVLGEVTPKTFAVRNAEDFSLFVSGPLLWFSRGIFPVRLLLQHLINLIMSVFGLGSLGSEKRLSGEEFEAVLEAGRADGILTGHEVQIVRRIFELGRIDAKEIMVPRTQVVAAEQQAKIYEVIELAKRSRRWRIPIYDNSIDNIWSVFYFKDLPAWRGQNIEDMTVEQFVKMRDGLNLKKPLGSALVRPVFLVPQSQWIDVLLGQMRQRGAHLAVLLDEYGGTAGLVTLEDILEEIVGEAFENSSGDEVAQQLSGTGLRLLGRSRIRELNRRFALDIPSGEPDTLGGYIMSLFGDVPEVGEHIDDGQLEFRVLKLSGRRVDAVHVRRLGRILGPDVDDTVEENLS